ncbi:MAG TPA: ABC transporter C-terminal domain-containing protein, partial [Candidatus Polarisedimenticolia bacterium]|nr:ABC transporter C-terminal domain-containing protein [Candidatus Polarisedimenticolia bacterium]
GPAGAAKGAPPAASGSGSGPRPAPAAPPAKTSLKQEAPRKESTGDDRRTQRREEAEARNRRNRELRVFKDRIAKLESTILPLENRLKEIDQAMAEPDTWHDPGKGKSLGEEKKSIEIELAHLYDDWDHATTEMQAEETRLG